MKRLVIGLLLLSSLPAFSQINAMRFQNIVSNLNSSQAGYSAGFKGRYNADGIVMGDIYLDSTFKKCNIYLYKSETSINSPSRLNLLHNEFEVQTTAGLRALSGAVVKQFVVSNSYSDSILYVNGKDFTYDGVHLDGFVGLLADGEARLVKQIEIDIIKPSYNPSLEVGDRNTHLKQKPVYYAARKGPDLFRIKNTKALLDFLSDQKPAMSKYIKENKLDVRNERDLLTIFNYYNSLQ